MRKDTLKYRNMYLNNEEQLSDIHRNDG